jgi:ribonuclease T2
MKRKGMSPFFALILLVVACNSRSRTTEVPRTANPGATPTTTRPTFAAPAAPFDFYLLNLSWSPEYCHSHPSAAECAAHASFVLHGLWPENAGGQNPENCSNAPGPSDPSAYRDIYPDAGLLEHEWSTHGTCTGLSPDEYFNEARAADHFVAIPASLSHLTSQVSMPPNQILMLFTQANPLIPRSSFALTCGSNYLTAVEVCLDKTLHPVACSAVVRSCRANMVRIPPP